MTEAEASMRLPKSLDELKRVFVAGILDRMARAGVRREFDEFEPTPMEGLARADINIDIMIIDIMLIGGELVLGG